MPVFRTNADRVKYLQLMAREGAESGLTFLGYCLMDNHVHLIVIPTAEDSLARGIGEAHRKYTWLLNRREGVKGYLFQGRFFSCPLDDGHLVAATRYAERNPVRANMTERAWDYGWSSAAFHVGLTHDDALVSDRGPCGPPGTWKKMLATDPDEMDILRKSSRTGRPCGSEAFIDFVEEFANRSLRPKPRGRPPKIGT